MRVQLDGDAVRPIDFSHHLVDFALRHIGDPYIWAAKGTFAVRDVVRGLDVHKGVVLAVQALEIGVPKGRLAFDCSGLVLWAALQAGSLDLRGWWGAEALREHLPPPAEHEPFALACYPGHVAIDLGRGLVLEAAGGDSGTLTYSQALMDPRGARVRVGFENRTRTATRSLAAIQHLPLRPPVVT